MGVIEAIILGVIQGFTEFLPVSSSGHLELVKFMLGEDAVPKESLTFTVILHFATALSTVIIFRQEVYQIFKGLFQFSWNEETFFSLKIIISMVPAVIIGLLFEEQLELFFSGQILLIGMMLLLTAVLLILADNSKTTDVKTTYKSAFIIGVAQAIAMLPGISRSGATISASVMLKIDRTRAARFSFLMVVPLIFGKIAKDLLGGDLILENTQVFPFFIGFLTAFISGLVACKWMLLLVKKSKLYYFSIYCSIVGLSAIFYSYYF